MKRTLFALLLVGAAVSGCSGFGTAAAVATGSVATVAPVAMADAEKALTGAHLLHKSAADFLATAATTNLCHGICASTAKTYLDQSEAYLVAADKLVALGNAQGITDKITAATALIAQAEVISGGAH